MASIAPPAAPSAAGESLLAPPSVPESLPLSKASSEEEHSGQLRVAMIGNVDSGKSTLTGCLTRNVVDDGRGAARVYVRDAFSSAFLSSINDTMRFPCRFSAIVMKPKMDALPQWVWK